MNILITGGAGYLGCVLTAKLLASGHKVTVYDNLERGGQGLRSFCADPHFNFVLGDVLELGLFPIGPYDVLIPLAGIVGQKACDRSYFRTTEVNAQAVSDLSRRKVQSQLLIYPMTNSGYGTTKAGETCTEDTELHPVSHYGRTKKLAEDAVLQRENSISLRLATVFGMSPNMRWDLLVNDFVRRMTLDRYLVVFQGQYRRNFVHVQDVADCIAYIVEDPLTEQRPTLKHKVYNLGNDLMNMTKAKLAHELNVLMPEAYVHMAEVGTDPDKRDYNVSSKRLADEGFVAQRGLKEAVAELVKGVQLD